jgi:PIN domain nuclease of toxin-antitoxin system
MRLLLDTHVFLWAVSDSRRLTARARSLLQQATAVHVSAASIWEITIKRRLGKITAQPGELIAAIDASGFHALDITPQHAAAMESLPDHHRDPFDRLLVAQALCEPLRLVTADETLARYSDLVLRI